MIPRRHACEKPLRPSLVVESAPASGDVGAARSGADPVGLWPMTCRAHPYRGRKERRDPAAPSLPRARGAAVLQQPRGGAELSRGSGVR